MPVIEISVWLDVPARRCSTEVRAFLDFHPEDHLDSEIELRLRPARGNRWRATFDVDAASERFGYRIGIAAHPDARWRMRIRNRDLDLDLLVDSDRLMSPKSWLIGECAVRPPCRVLSLPQGRKKVHGL